MGLIKLVRFFSFLLIVANVSAQLRQPAFPDSLFTTYYHQRVSLFKSLPQTKGDIIFLGNSITDGGEWSELFQDNRLKNRGISGDISAGVMHRLDEITQRKPAKLFLMIGINDLAKGITPDSLLKNLYFIAEYMNQHTPATQVYVQSLLPVNNGFGKFGGHTGKAAEIVYVNAQLKKYALSKHYSFIDLHTEFCDASGKLDKRYTNDGLHLTGEGYLLWKHFVYPYVFDLQQQPALIPLPQQLQWKDTRFPLNDCRTILTDDKSLSKEVIWLEKAMQEKGLFVSSKDKTTGSEPYIQLKLEKVQAPQLSEEAYRLKVTADKVLLVANTPKGISNGLQTLLQLMRDGVMINGCEIVDWPAFAWRAYMIDVGRNYMSMDLLKQQIDVMSRYKYNIFHFHFTEDIAWRLAIKQYPQLTAPQNMQRDKGQYYTEVEMKELIAYCRERHITLVPEIDMPGHSAAFTRAMGFSMQSDSGLAVVKNILKAFIETYGLDYLHIGADEVKITNKNFVPEVTAFVQSFGKKVIGWEPGGNFTGNTIRQLWMDDNGKISRNGLIQYIDSRHLYLNHMDPLEAVVTIFNRRIGDKPKGDKNLLGGTLCLWHDRAVAKEEDVLKMNPVYPGMLAFSERSWRGGGQTGWVANINDGDTTGFTGFENRLLDHKRMVFADKPFPYTRQSNVLWQLYGPFQNGGDLSEKFEPELPGFDNTRLKPYKLVAGGTVVLRHWWAPLIKGALDQPADSTTWYATTKIWSEEDGQKDFWIGFNNLSRSPATDSPPVGAWDNKKSEVWVNEKLIEPPHWKRGGQKGDSEIPLTDEGYEYRQPTTIFLKKGWNTVLIKAPVGSFKGKDWQNPVKWMFSFVPGSSTN
ncbi:MAG: family 20 glycosylhydrolase [Bacteroidota bacterium]